MKPGIHPDYHPVVFQDATTGKAFLTRSTITRTRTIDWKTPTAPCAPTRWWLSKSAQTLTRSGPATGASSTQPARWRSSVAATGSDRSRCAPAQRVSVIHTARSHRKVPPHQSRRTGARSTPARTPTV